MKRYTINWVFGYMMIRAGIDQNAQMLFTIFCFYFFVLRLKKIDKSKQNKKGGSPLLL